MTQDPRRALPSVNALLESEGVRSLLAHAPRDLVVRAVRETLDVARRAPDDSLRVAADWARAVGDTLERHQRRSLRRVINATGVVLHTNLGRAPLPRVAIQAIEEVARGYSNLEYDIDAGARGSRYVHCSTLLRELTGAEDALVVNNGAAGLVLALDTIASGRDAIISRGELVEIGGSFRIPDIMAKSGARLVEVGTTNRTHVDDYRSALSDRTGALVKVHRSNFAMDGFVAEVGVDELASLAQVRGVPVLHDLGSGLLMSLDAFGLTGEPTARDVIRAGASIVVMSGDKLLGGPQAGIVLGTNALIGAMRRNPLTRSYRVDKLTLAALEATLTLYREPERAAREIPALAMLTASAAEVRERAERMARGVGSGVRVVESLATVGGGAFPTARIPSFALAIEGNVVALEQQLRAGVPSVVARISDERVQLDVRTVLPDDEDDLVRVLHQALDGGRG
jgi:L-seryl-tRNA(Ser) seleniumtransferase